MVQEGLEIMKTTKIDGQEFESPLAAALHLLWLLQRLSFYEKHREGQPSDGFRFREGIIEARKLLKQVGYEPGPGDGMIRTEEPKPAVSAPPDAQLARERAERAHFLHRIWSEISGEGVS